MRADRFAERVAENVAVARTRVPTAVDTDAMVDQSVTARPSRDRLRSAQDVLALEPPQADEREEQHVAELQPDPTPHVGVPLAPGDEIDPRVEVVRGEHVADVAERADGVEDQRREVEADAGEDRTEGRV